MRIEDLTTAYGVEIFFTYGDNPCLTIKNSHKVTSDSAMEIVLKYIHRSGEYARLVNSGYTRTFSSELREWKGHNFLYRMGIKPERTGTVNIDQNEPKWRRIVYAILSVL